MVPLELASQLQFRDSLVAGCKVSLESGEAFHTVATDAVVSNYLDEAN